MRKGIQHIFKEVPQTYEMINHLLTLDLDIVWRKKVARIAALHGGERWLDVCCGTGELIQFLNQCAPEETAIHGVDFSYPMLEQARRKPSSVRINYSLADVSQLPFQDERFDLITISFATRNINRNERVLQAVYHEFHRVLKPGGLFINLETSQPSFKIIRYLFHQIVALTVKPVGGYISGSKVAYRYLAHTIPRFYDPEKLASIIRHAGFAEARYFTLMFGAAAIHSGIK